MKSIIKIGVIVIVAVMLAAVIPAGCGEEEEVITLSFSSWEGGPDDTPMTRLKTFWADEVERQTDGRVKVEFYWGGQLASAAEDLALIETGGADIAGIAAGYYGSEIPLHASASQLPWLIEDPEDVNPLMWELYDEVPALVDEAEEHNFIVMCFGWAGPYFIHGKNPILSLDDLNGKKIRGWGSYLPVVYEAIGATSVSVVYAEKYGAFQTGLLDIELSDLGAFRGAKLYEILKHTSLANLGTFQASGIYMNLDRFNSLPEDIQDIMLDVGRNLCTERVYEIAPEIFEEDREYLEDQGVTIHEFPAAEMAEWKDRTGDLLELWVDNMEAIGLGSEAEQMADVYRDYLGI